MNFKVNHKKLRILYLTYPFNIKEIGTSEQGIRKRTFFNFAMASMKKYSIEVDYLPTQSYYIMSQLLQTIKTIFFRKRYHIILTATGTGLLLALTRFFLRWEKPYLYLIKWRIETRSILDPLLKQIYRRYVDKIICVSSVQKEIFAKILNISKNRIINIPYGIDTEFFKPEINNISNNDVILCVGDTDRDDETLFKALKFLPFKLIRISDESKIFNSYKMQQRDKKSSNLNKKFVLLHAVSDLTLKKSYAKSAIVIIPIYKSSNQPAGLTTLLEAMAMGKSVIVTKGLITEDYVINFKTGIVIPSDDVDNMKKAILQLLNNKLERKRIGNNARRWVEANFTIERNAEKLVHLFKSISM